jgi:hypothetical protein
MAGGSAGAIVTYIDESGKTQRVSEAFPLPTAGSNSAEDAAAIGSVTETAPASDTASSGLNGRLQRIAQRLTSILTALGAALTVKKDQQTVTACVIASGQSLSPAIDLGVGRLVGITTPSNIDSATAVTFQASYDNATWNNVYDSSGVEKTLTVGVSRWIILSPADFYGMRYVKVRLGTSGTPVAATADRTLQLIAEA